MKNPQAILNEDNTAIKAIRYTDGNHLIEISIDDFKDLTQVVSNLESHLNAQAMAAGSLAAARKKIVPFPGQQHPYDRPGYLTKVPEPSIPEPIKEPNYRELLTGFFDMLHTTNAHDFVVITRTPDGTYDDYNVYTFFSQGGNDDKVAMALLQGAQCIVKSNVVID